MKLQISPGLSLEPETSLDEWSEQGRQLCGRADHLSWELADWAAFAELFDGEKPANAVQRASNALKSFCDSHGMNYGSSRQAAQVARMFPAEKRFSTVLYGKYTVIAAFRLPEKKRLHWVKVCAEENLSCGDLRERIRASLGTDNAKAADGPVTAFATKHALDLQSFLTKQPREFWTVATRTYWRGQLKPLVEIYEGLGAND